MPIRTDGFCSFLRCPPPLVGKKPRRSRHHYYATTTTFWNFLLLSYFCICIFRFLFLFGLYHNELWSCFIDELQCVRVKSATRGTPSGPLFFLLLRLLFGVSRRDLFTKQGAYFFFFSCLKQKRQKLESKKIGRREKRPIRRRHPRSPSSSWLSYTLYTLRLREVPTTTTTTNQQQLCAFFSLSLFLLFNGSQSIER